MHWTIGKRVTFGFSGLVIISLVLGALAVVGMRKTHVEIDDLRREEVPEVTIVNQIERDVLLTMYQVRVYGLHYLHLNHHNNDLPNHAFVLSIIFWQLV